MKGKSMQKEVLAEILYIMSISDTRVRIPDKLLGRITRKVCDREKVRFDFMMAVAENTCMN